MPSLRELFRRSPKDKEAQTGPSTTELLKKYHPDLHPHEKGNKDRIKDLGNFAKRFPLVHAISVKARELGLGSAPVTYEQKLPILGIMRANVVIHSWQKILEFAGKVDRQATVGKIIPFVGPMNGQSADPEYQAAKKEVLPMFARFEKQYGEAFRKITADAMAGWGRNTETGEGETQKLGELMIDLFHKYTELLLAGPDLSNPYHPRAKQIYYGLTSQLLPYLKQFESQSSTLVQGLAAKESGPVWRAVFAIKTFVERAKNRFEPIFSDEDEEFSQAIQEGLFTLHQEILAATPDATERAEIYSTLGHFGILLSGMEGKKPDVARLQQHSAEDYAGASRKVIGMLIAAEGTTRFAANSMITILGQRPDIFEKLRTLRSSGDQAAYDAYADNVILEVLRLVPPTPVRMLEFTEDVDIEPGIRLPKGTGVIYNLADMLRDPNLFSDPDTANPDRYDATEDGQPGEDRTPVDAVFMYIKGYKQRCLGITIAHAQMRDILDGLADNFSQINLKNKGKVKPNTNLTQTLVDETGRPSEVEFVR